MLRSISSRPSCWLLRSVCSESQATMKIQGVVDPSSPTKRTVELSSVQLKTEPSPISMISLQPYLPVPQQSS